MIPLSVDKGAVHQPAHVTIKWESGGMIPLCVDMGPVHRSGTTEEFTNLGCAVVGIRLWMRVLSTNPHM